MEVTVDRATTDSPRLMQKIEMDLSFGKGNDSRESGVFSNESASSGASGGSASSGHASANTSWERFQDECMDPSVFDPPIRNSSGLSDKRRNCNISTIDGTLASSIIGMTHH